MAQPTIVRQTYLNASSGNGAGIIIVKAFINGTGDDSTTLIDASSYTNSPEDLKIMKITYCLNGFSAYLRWNADTPVNIISLATDHPSEMNFHDIGGLINNGGTGVNGDILITTTGLASPDNGFILIYMKVKDSKQYIA